MYRSHYNTITCALPLLSSVSIILYHSSNDFRLPQQNGYNTIPGHEKKPSQGPDILEAQCHSLIRFQSGCMCQSTRDLGIPLWAYIYMYLSSMRVVNTESSPPAGGG